MRNFCVDVLLRHLAAAAASTNEVQSNLSSADHPQCSVAMPPASMDHTSSTVSWQHPPASVDDTLSSDVVNSRSTLSLAWNSPLSSSVAAPPAVVAGVQLTQLPPIQRELFLRIHHQQHQQQCVATASHVPASSESALIHTHGSVRLHSLCAFC